MSFPGFDFENEMCRLDYGVWIQGNRSDPFLHQKARELRIVGRCLAANSNLFPGTVRRIDGHLNHFLDRAIPLVKKVRDHFGITIETERQLRQIIRTDGVAVKNS